MKQTSSLHTQKVTQAQALKNTLIKNRQACFKQGDMWALLRKHQKKLQQSSKKILQHYNTYTFDTADLQVEGNDVSAEWH
jgi:hypothetical protein